MLEAALEVDPNYPQALAALAWAYEQGRWFGDPSKIEQYRKSASHYARRGLATKSDDAYVQAICGFVVFLSDHDVQTAIAAKDRALLKNPNSAWVNDYCSMIETWTGNPQTGLELAERALRQNPLDPNKWHFLHALGEALIGLERWEEAGNVSDRVIADNPSWYPALIQSAVVSAKLGELGAAHDYVNRLLSIDPGATISGFLDEGRPVTPRMQRSLREGLSLAGLPE